MDDQSRAPGRFPNAFGSELHTVILSTAATLLFLQSYRVFVPYLIFEIDQSQRRQLGSIGLVVFGLAFLGALLYRLAGGRMTLWLAVAAMTVARLGVQFSRDPELRWILGAATVIGWCWVLIVLLPRSGEQLAIGMGFAFAIDLIVRGLRGTLDLPWMPGMAAHVATVVITAALVIATWALTARNWVDKPESDFTLSLRYAGIGSGIALWLVAAGNLGFASETSTLRLPTSFALLSLGTLLALASRLTRSLDRSISIDTRLRAVGPGLLAAIVILVWNSDITNRWLDALLTLLFAWAVTIAIMRATTSARAGEQRGRWRSAATLTLGLLIQIGFIFLYFARSGPILFMLLPVAVLALAPLVGRQSSRDTIPNRAMFTQGFAAVALLSIAAAGWLFINDASPGASSPDDDKLTVMSFNIQEGFSNENHWSLETTAQTIEAHAPDIVFLQEITRGWLVMSSVDEVRWLADRLDMHYAYASNSHDGLWGNAILSRFPIVSEYSIIFTHTDNLRRGAVAIETPNANLLFIDTHLDNPHRATPVRLEQIQELLDLWGGAKPAIIAGDFNADPGSEEWQAMIDAGFVDAAGTDETTTSEDNRRIDYIWVTSDLHIDTYEVPDIWASDHRPVVVSLSLAV